MVPSFLAHDGAPHVPASRSQHFAPYIGATPQPLTYPPLPPRDRRSCSGMTEQSRDAPELNLLQSCSGLVVLRCRLGRAETPTPSGDSEVLRHIGEEKRSEGAWRECECDCVWPILQQPLAVRRHAATRGTSRAEHPVCSFRE